MGKCPNCGDWNSLVETVVSTNPKSKIQSSKQAQNSKPIKLSEIVTKNIERMKIGIDELDQVLGGGLVPGQVVLLAGEPGIGKSTLLLQIAAAITKSALADENLFGHELLPSKSEGRQTTTRSRILSSSRSNAVLHASGEESVEQISIRSRRLGLGGNSSIQLLAETNVENIIEVIEQLSDKVIKEDKAGDKKNYSRTHLLNYFYSCLFPSF